MQPLIECHDLGLSYSRLIWDAVNVTMEPGQLIGLVGLNGSGKTSFLRILSGLQKATTGRITGPAYSSKPSIFHALFLDESSHYYRHLTSQEMLEFYMRLVQATRTRTEEIIDALHLEPVLSTTVGSLSQGYRTRLSLAFGLMSPASVLLLDEMFSSLDVVVIESLKRQLQNECDNGRTIVVSSHQLDVVQTLTQTYWWIHQHQIHSVLSTDMPMTSLSALLRQDQEVSP